MDRQCDANLGPYQLIEVIRHGGMATVYKAYQPSLDRVVAVKVADHHHDRQLVARFQAEARIVAQLQHPNILQVYDYGEHDGRLYLVSPYVEQGATLADVRTPLAFDPALQLTRQLLLALEYAHARGVVHRDIKPSNVLLPAPAWPLLADFGIAKLLDGAGADVTAAGQVIGTAAYMAPEQAAGELVDARTDLYAVGVLLYELVTGQVPFGASPRGTVLARHATAPPPAARGVNPALPAAIEPVLQRALAKRPEERYQSAGAMAADLERLMAQPGPVAADAPTAATRLVMPAGTRLRRSWASALLALALLVASLGGVAGALAWRGGGPSPEASPTPANPGSAPGTQAGLPAGAQASGRVAWRDKSHRNDQIVVAARGLPPPEAGQVYAAWLSGQDGGLALGRLRPGDQDDLIVYYTSPTGENLLQRYDRVSITQVPEAAAETEVANVVLTGALPKEALVHIRHLLVSFDATPSHAGLALGLRQEVDQLRIRARLLKRAYDEGDLEGEKVHAEQLINIIDGAQGEHFGDRNGDGRVQNPGDGFGLLKNGRQVGYIEGMVGHALLAAAAPDATEATRSHARAVQTTGETIRGRVTEIRARALRLGRANDPAETQEDVQALQDLVTRAIEGADQDGDGQIEPLPGEGGVSTAYRAAQLMAEMRLAPASPGPSA
jgi:hypothetical protein